MTLLISKLIIRVQHTKMLTLANINQAIIAAPAIRMNHGLKRDMTTNHLLQRTFTTIWHDLGINRAIALEDAEDNRFASSAASTLATDSTSAKVRFVNFDLASKGRGAFTFFGDPLADFDKEHSHRAARQSSKFGCFTGRQIMREEADQLAHFTFTNFGTSVITI